MVIENFKLQNFMLLCFVHYFSLWWFVIRLIDFVFFWFLLGTVSFVVLTELFVVYKKL